MRREGGRIQGTKALEEKKKKKGAKCNRARRKGAERRKMLPGERKGGTVASKAEVMELLCSLQSCLSTFPGKPVFQITVGSGCGMQMAGCWYLLVR